MDRIYIDSHLIINRIIGKGEAKSDAKSILYKICSHYREIIIPQIILGESLIKILEKSDEDEMSNNMTDFCDLIEETIQDIKKHTPPLRKEILEVALGISDDDW